MTDVSREDRSGHTVYEYGERPPSEAIVDAIADALGSPPDECGPLYDAIDPDALDAAMAHDASLRTRFTYADHEVVVTPARVYVRPLEEV